MVTLRPATLDDAEGMARVRVDTWRSAYRGIVPQDYLDNLSYETAASFWRKVLGQPPGARPFAFVAEDGPGRIVGIAMGGPERESDPEYRGGIYVLYVLPAYQGKGIGHRLVSACARRLLDDGIESLLIWVLVANPYRRFYERLGGVAVREKLDEVGGEPTVEVGYGWKDLRPLIGEEGDGELTTDLGTD